MCRSENRRAWFASGVTAGALLFSASCATTNPPKQQFRSFFIPPARTSKVGPLEPLAEAPGLAGSVPKLDLYAFETPGKTPLPALPRPSDGEFAIRQADEHFNAGKRAFELGHMEDARREFNRSIDALLSAPASIADRSSIDRRLEELTESIYRYDLDQQNAQQ